MLSPKNIIIRMPNWLGDLVMATPVLADVRKFWPEANITAMCQSNVAPLLKCDPNVDFVYSYSRPSGWIRQIHHGEVICAIRQGEFDLGILLTNSFSSAWWFWRGRVKTRIGFAGNCRSWLLSEAVPFPEKKEAQHLVLTYKTLLEPLKIPLSDTPPRLFISTEEKDETENFLKNLKIDLSHDVIVGVNPGAAYGSAKCWLPDRFKAVTKHLLENPRLYILYFGDKAGSALVQEICSGFPERVINLAGKTTIREAMALIQKCSAFLTNDSGPMHICAALGTPMVALFGSTSDVKTGPYGKSEAVIHKHVECSPCYKRECPIDFRCMTQISVEEVYAKLLKCIATKVVSG